MATFVVVLLSATPLLLACRPEGVWWEEPPGSDKDKPDPYFPSGDKWGGWSPPEGTDNWKKWIEKWGKDRTTDRPESGEWSLERGIGSGWPQHWRGYGLGIDGVPPPPWAYVPDSYDKPQYCFHMPKFGRCSDNVTRWAFNPSRNQCQPFFYSGCGGNDNNFLNKQRCTAACVETAATDCDDEPGVNIEELLTEDLSPQHLMINPKVTVTPRQILGGYISSD